MQTILMCSLMLRIIGHFHSPEWIGHFGSIGEFPTGSFPAALFNCMSSGKCMILKRAPYRHKDTDGTTDPAVFPTDPCQGKQTLIYWGVLFITVEKLKSVLGCRWTSPPSEHQHHHQRHLHWFKGNISMWSHMILMPQSSRTHHGHIKLYTLTS